MSASCFAESAVSQLQSIFKISQHLVLQVSANQAELQELEATEQHLKRQHASLTERLSRLENQSALKREAAVSAVEEQLKEKEAIEAENAAARAKMAENEAMVSERQLLRMLKAPLLLYVPKKQAENEIKVSNMHHLCMRRMLLHVPKWRKLRPW